MLTRCLTAVVCVWTLAACGAPDASDTPAVEAAAAQAPRVSTTPCELTNETDLRPAGTAEIYSAMLSDDEPVGIMIWAPEGSTCAEPVANTHTCIVRGPRVAVTVQDVMVFAIPEGRTATLTHNAEGRTQCFLNEEAG